MAEREVSGEEYRAITSSRPPVRPRHNQLIWVIVVLIAALALSFYGGVQYQKAHKGVSSTSRVGGLGFGRRGALGQVTAISATSITINNARTSASETYTITNSTAISNNGQTVSYSDIQNGDTVIISTSGSGSTTASRVIINPNLGGFGGGSATAPPSSSH